MVYVLKMEYVSKINIFGLKMMVKSGLEFFFANWDHLATLVQSMKKSLTTELLSAVPNSPTMPLKYVLVSKSVSIFV